MATTTAAKKNVASKNLVDSVNSGSALAQLYNQLKGKTQAAYSPQYSDQISAGIDKVVNREAFSYDPMKDANYQALAKLYNQQGSKAAKDTLGDAAALNGGYGSSYAVTASQQVRNDYNQQLASMIPSLQEAAYNKYKDAYNMDVTNLQLLQDADDRAYGRHRDTVADNQWQKTYDRNVYESDRNYDYQKERDAISDKQWADEFAYQKDRDAVADKQWQTTYDRNVFESDRDYNYQKDRDVVEDKQWKTAYDRGVYESDRDYKYQQSRDSVADSQWAKEYALAKKGNTTSGGSSSGGYIGSSAKSSGSGNSKNYDVAKLAAQGLSAVTGAVDKTKKSVKK